MCLRTGDSGDDATGQFADPGILGEVYVGPYLAFEPGSALVVDADGTASAYALCAPDTAAFEQRCEAQWWPRLRVRYPRGSFPAGTPDDEVVEIIHDPPRANPRLLVDYPAHLHIDLVAEVQGRGFGGELIRSLLATQAGNGVRGIHLDVATSNTRAIGFYEHLGFTILRPGDDSTTMGMLLVTS